MTRIRLPYIHSFRDRHGKVRHYARPPRRKQVPLPGTPGSGEFMSAYQAALAGLKTPDKIGAARTVAGTLNAIIVDYLDCSPNSTSPLKRFAPETQRTQRNILQNLRSVHGVKRVYRIESNGRRAMVLTREHVQRMVNQKSDTPFAQRNFLNTIRAMFRWAVAEGRVPDDPTLGVTRKKIESSGYTTWSEENIAQYKQKHCLGTKERLTIELALNTAARRADLVRLGPQHIHEDTLPSNNQRPKVARKRPSPSRCIPTFAQH
jgi:hypothetical protein